MSNAKIARIEGCFDVSLGREIYNIPFNRPRKGRFINITVNTKFEKVRESKVAHMIYDDVASYLFITHVILMTFIMLHLTMRL